MLSDKWKKWAADNSSAIDDGFERDFVAKVLSRVHVIEPEMVIAQYVFKCSISKNRRIDFVIKNDSTGYFLAIELDGARRGEAELQSSWADFLQRQNDLLERVGPLLRFSNSQMFKNAQYIIDKITETLLEQNKSYIHQQKILNQQRLNEENLTHLKAQLNDANAKLKTAVKNQTDQHKQEDIELLIAKLKEQHDVKIIEIAQSNQQLSNSKHAELKQAIAQSQADLVESNKEKTIMLRTMYVLTAVVVSAMLFVVFKLSNISDSKVETIYMQSETSPSEAVIAAVERTAISAPANQSVGSTEVSDADLYTDSRVGKDIYVAKEPEPRAAPATDSVSLPLAASQVNIPRIAASQAPFYLGKVVYACGQVAELSRFKKGIYLNLDKTYPNQSLTLVVWQDTLDMLAGSAERVQALVNKSVCIEGQIDQYNSALQIKIADINDIIVN